MSNYKTYMLMMCLFFYCIPLLAQDQTILLIRHAEKLQDAGTDPGLSALGQQRANRLIELFTSFKPAAIFTTQYQRTQLTGQPLATALNIPLTIFAMDKDNTQHYSDLLMKRICELPKGANVLVIGHSNSIPTIVEEWTNEPVKPIKDSEFDRFFLVKISNCQVVGNLDIRY